MPRIIIIDDDKDANEILKRFFERRGIEVDVALTVDVGLTLIRDNPPDLLLLDMFLGGESGLSVLRTLGGGKLPFPVIVVSGSIDQGAINQAKGLGAEDVLIKPVVLDDIKKIVYSKLGLKDSA